jgi:hypothetical protein
LAAPNCKKIDLADFERLTVQLEDLPLRVDILTASLDKDILNAARRSDSDIHFKWPVDFIELGQFGAGIDNLSLFPQKTGGL